MSNILRAANSADLLSIISRNTVVTKDGERYKFRCSFHNEKTPSCVLTHNGKWRFCCFGCGAKGDAVDYVAKLNGITSIKAAELILSGNHGMVVDFRAKPKEKIIHWQEIDWQSHVRQFDHNRMNDLMRWRGYSWSFIQWMKAQGLIGCHEGAFAFPIRQEGRVVRLHCRYKSGKGWFYHPAKGARTDALIIGSGDVAHVHESSWDIWACMDSIGYHRKPQDVWIATRGASNAHKLAPLACRFKRLYLYKQADAASDKWASDIVKQLDNCVVVDAPKGFKDWNDCIRAGGYF